MTTETIDPAEEARAIRELSHLQGRIGYGKKISGKEGRSVRALVSRHQLIFVPAFAAPAVLGMSHETFLGYVVTGIFQPLGGAGGSRHVPQTALFRIDVLRQKMKLAREIRSRRGVSLKSAARVVGDLVESGVEAIELARGLADANAVLEAYSEHFGFPLGHTDLTERYRQEFATALADAETGAVR